MGHGHSHSHVPANPSAGHARRLQGALAITGAFLVVELVAAFVTGSLALLSDAAHMFTDVAALGVALAAIRIGQRPADRKRTFGYQRFEILAAAFNAIMLFVVAAYILWEAWRRLAEPVEIQSVPMLVVAVLGAVANLASMKLLQGAQGDSLNVRGAYLEVLADLVGSAGVIVAAAVIWATGWSWVDSLVAALIGLWVVPRTWSLLRDSLNILLQGAPDEIDLAALEQALLGTPGVAAVHALHVWTITTGRHVMSAHLVVAAEALADETFLARVGDDLAHRFGLTHTTIQLESIDAPVPHCEHAAAAPAPERASASAAASHHGHAHD